MIASAISARRIRYVYAGESGWRARRDAGPCDGARPVATRSAPRTSLSGSIFKDQRPDQVTTTDHADQHVLTAAPLDNRETAQLGREHAIDRRCDRVAGTDCDDAPPHGVRDVLGEKVPETRTKGRPIVTKYPQEVEFRTMPSSSPASSTTGKAL